MEEVTGAAGGEPIGLSHIGAKRVQPITQRGDGVVQTPHHVGARQVVGGDESEDGVHAPVIGERHRKGKGRKGKGGERQRGLC